MSLTGRSRIAIGLTACTLVGILIAAILLLLHETWRSGAAVTNVIVQMHNGRQSVTWTLITHNLVGIRVTASDPSYSGIWADRDMWSRGSHWDEITVTVGDKDGSFVWEYSARARGRATIGGSHGVGSGAKSLVFTNLRQRGYAPLGTVLGSFTLETQDGRTVDGQIALIEVTEELLYPLKRSDTTEGRKEKAD